MPDQPAQWPRQGDALRAEPAARRLRRGARARHRPHRPGGAPSRAVAAAGRDQRRGRGRGWGQGGGQAAVLVRPADRAGDHVGRRQAADAERYLRVHHEELPLLPDGGQGLAGNLTENYPFYRTADKGWQVTSQRTTPSTGRRTRAGR